MARKFNYPNVGTSGRRRIVPIMAIDFIAGQIDQKGSTVTRVQNSKYIKPYGNKGASIGGRTRKWSSINFLNVNNGMGRTSPITAKEVQARNNFLRARKSALATLQNLSVYTLVQMDFANGTSRQNVSPNDYATMAGWVQAVRSAQIADGQTITEETNTWFS